jgi:hypothetical protein
MLSNADLTRIYKEANGIPEGKEPPISTQKIFTAMRAMRVLALREAAERIRPTVVGELSSLSGVDEPSFITKQYIAAQLEQMANDSL